MLKQVGSKIRRTPLILCALGISVLSGITGRLEAGFVDVNVYPELTETNTDSVSTVNVFSKLPGRWHYFSLTNLINKERSSEFSGSYNFYTEQNLRWQVAEGSPFDLTAQLNLRSGKDKERFRLGTRWRISDTPALRSLFESVSLKYSINFHLLQLDHAEADVWQMEHVFRMTFPGVSNRLYLAGFVDHTFKEDLPVEYPNSPIVGEAQLGYRLVGNWHAVAEYRINEYRRSDTRNLAFGMQYLFKW